MYQHHIPFDTLLTKFHAMDVTSLCKGPDKSRLDALVHIRTYNGSTAIGIGLLRTNSIIDDSNIAETAAKKKG